MTAAERRVYIRACVIRGVILLAACFYGTIELFKLLKAFIMNPFSFFYVKKRRNPPACMTDTKYGTHGYADVNGVRLHYVANGKKGAPMVLFVHGWPECWYSWRNQLVAMADEYYVVAFDLRGAGWSSKPRDKKDFLEPVIVEDIRSMITHLGYQKAHVVGHDWGAGFAQAFAYYYPNMCEKLVVSNFPVAKAQLIWAMTNGLTSWYYFFFYQLPVLPLIASLHNDMDKLSSEMKSPIHGITNDKLLSKEDIEVYKHAHPDVSSWLSYLNYPRASLSVDGIVYKILKRQKEGGKIPRIRVKTLILWGENDIYIPPVFAYISQQYIDESTVKLLDARHWVQQMQPEAYTAALREFFVQK